MDSSNTIAPYFDGDVDTSAMLTQFLSEIGVERYLRRETIRDAHRDRTVYAPHTQIGRSLLNSQQMVAGGG